MGIDISALMQDPQMQFGLGLLGAGRSMNPVADAATMMQSMQNAQNQHQLQLQQIERMKQQTTNEKQQQALGLLSYLQNARLIQQAQNENPQTGAPMQPPESLPNVAGNLPPALAQLLPDQATGLTGQFQQNQQQAPMVPPSQIPQGNGMPQAAPVGQPPMQQVPQPTGKFGTPMSLLNNLVQIESSGNPHAIGPSVPGQGNAMGLYQFMPKTAQMLKAQGVDFNPLVPDQRLHDAADFYFQQLLKQNGGDVTKALNAWQGAQKTAGSNANQQYNARALNGVQMPAALPAGLPQTGAPNSATPIAGVPANTQALSEAHRAGILGLAMGDKGAAMSKYAEMLKPQAVTSGATVLGPNGQASQLPMTPQQRQQTLNETPGPNGMTPADVSKMGMQNLQTAQEKVAASRDLVKDIPQTLDALNQAKAALPGAINYMGPAGDRKLEIVKFLNQTFGLNITPDAITNADTFKSQVTQPLLASVKTTGGRMSVQEIAKMQANFGSLETDPKAMANILDLMTSRYQNTLSEHNKFATQFDTMMGPTAHLNYSVQPNVSTPAPAVGTSTAPKVGFTKGGYMFKGGDPSNKASWAPVPGSQ